MAEVSLRRNGSPLTTESCERRWGELRNFGLRESTEAVAHVAVV